jgi:molybdopterin molybdotransferase
MGRLSCDGPEVGSAPMRVDEALAAIRHALNSISGAETVAVAGASGRVLAADVLAPIDLPPFANSAVDGYAFRSSDLSAEAPTTLPVAARVAAGAMAGPLPPGTVARIFTGAPLPPGADSVVMQEDVRRDGQAATLPPRIALGANCRRAGEDVASGRIALGAGRLLGARDIALAAGLGLTGLPVRRRLRVGLFSTGDEVTETGARLAAAGIHDANRPMLMALLTQAGAVPADLGILRDESRPLRDRLVRAAADHDLIVTSGGVSVGEEDHVRAAVTASGALTLWRLAIKPGRPLAFGRVADTPFVGLPGNPGAAYVTALVILLPLMRHLLGAGQDAPLPLVRSGFTQAKRRGRREYLKVTLRTAEDGVTEAVPAPGGALSGLAASDGFAELAEEAETIRPGDFLPFRAHPLG